MQLIPLCSIAQDYHVGPNQNFLTISEVPSATLAPGDHVYIHWKPLAYNEKWVINRRGNKEQPIVVTGVLGSNGELPIIDGRDAITARGLNYVIHIYILMVSNDIVINYS